MKLLLGFRGAYLGLALRFSFPWGKTGYLSGDKTGYWDKKLEKNQSELHGQE